MLYRETGQFKTSYAADMAIFPIRQDRIAFWILLAAAFIALPVLDHYQLWPLRGEYLIRAILIPFLILALATIGLNILTGYCGQLSLGSGAFMAVGAYSAYKFATGVHIPLEIFTISIPPLPVLPAILLGGLMSAVVGILFGVPSLRIKGLYLAVATLAAQFFFDWLFIRVKWFTNYTSSGSVTAPELNSVARLGRSLLSRSMTKTVPPMRRRITISAINWAVRGSIQPIRPSNRIAQGRSAEVRIGTESRFSPAMPAPTSGS